MTSTNCNSNVDTSRQWSLDALYKGFDDKAYVKNCEKFSQLIDEYIAALAPSAVSEPSTLRRSANSLSARRSCG